MENPDEVSANEKVPANKVNEVASEIAPVVKKSTRHKAGIKLDVDKLIKHVMQFDSVERQLAFLTDACMLKKRQVEKFQYDDWVMANNLTREEAYEYIDDSEIVGDDGETYLFPEFIELEWECFENVQKKLYNDLQRYLDEINTFIDAKCKILKIPSIVEQLNAIPEQIANKNQLNAVEPIQWNGTDTQLIYLFNELCKKGLMPMTLTGKMASVLESHFLNHKGEPVKDVDKKWYNMNGAPPRQHSLIDGIIEGIPE